jgi:hypothetical protein
MRTPSALSTNRSAIVSPTTRTLTVFQLLPSRAFAFDAALGVLKAQGALLVDVEMPKLDGLGAAEFAVLLSELKGDLNAYLATTPAAVKTRTLKDVMAFNTANAAAEMPYFAQETFEAAEKTRGLDDPEYLGARAKSKRAVSSTRSAPTATACAFGLGQRSRGSTRRNALSPKFIMARATAPMFSPICGRTRTMAGQSSAIGGGMSAARLIRRACLARRCATSLHVRRA